MAIGSKVTISYGISPILKSGDQSRGAQGCVQYALLGSLRAS
jgi:hypothetical protein